MSNDLAKLESYQWALANVKTVEEAAELRAKMGLIAKQIAPMLRRDRYKWGKAYVEACVKHGQMWNACDQWPKHLRQDLASEDDIKKFISAQDAMFKNHMDARMCACVAELDPQDLRDYFEDCRQNNTIPSLGGAYKIWQMLNPKDDPPRLEGAYRIIYADPPWEYGNVRGDLSYTSQEDKYPTMSTEDICAIDVKSHVWSDAVLFLWATSPILFPDAFEVIKAWGFQYKTSFVWDKVRHNPGHYNSVRHEFLLLATRGACTPDNSKLYPSVQRIERSGVHSEKPEEFRAIIDDIYPMGPRAELFARKEMKGWDVYGNEIS